MQDELEEIKKGATWQNIYDCLWVIATVRYVTRQQMAKHFPDAVWRQKIATKNKLELLVQKGFLRQSADGVYVASSKAYKFLREHSGKNCQIIKLPSGTGERDSVYNSDQLLRIIQLPDFPVLFYPVFYKNKKDDQPFLIPDGAVVFKKDNMAKLIFLEIEMPKPDWQNYLEKKRWKYNLIARRPETWSEWWKAQCEKLGVGHCTFEEFGFTVWCVGDVKADWPGWIFSSDIKSINI